MSIRNIVGPLALSISGLVNAADATAQQPSELKSISNKATANEVRDAGRSAAELASRERVNTSRSYSDTSNQEIRGSITVVNRPEIHETEHEAYSKDPRFADYEAYVKSRVNQILPKDIPNRNEILNIFANGTVDKVFNDPNSMKSSEYQVYISQIYQNAKNSFGEGYKQFDSFVTTMAGVQGGRNIPPKYATPSNIAIFNQNQSNAILAHPNYNDAFNAIGYASGGIVNGGRTAEQVSELSSRILEKYIGKSVASNITTSPDVASVVKK